MKSQRILSHETRRTPGRSPQPPRDAREESSSRRSPAPGLGDGVFCGLFRRAGEPPERRSDRPRRGRTPDRVRRDRILRGRAAVLPAAAAAEVDLGGRGRAPDDAAAGGELRPGARARVGSGGRSLRGVLRRRSVSRRAGPAPRPGRTDEGTGRTTNRTTEGRVSREDGDAREDDRRDGERDARLDAFEKRRLLVRFFRARARGDGSLDFLRRVEPDDAMRRASPCWSAAMTNSTGT